MEVTLKNDRDGYQLAEEFTSLHRGAAIKLFNKDGYSLGTYLNGGEVNDMQGVLPLSTIGPNENVPILDILPSSFQIGSWDEDFQRFRPENGVAEMKDLAELQRLTVLSPRSSRK
jgi:hypothetical protein